MSKSTNSNVDMYAVYWGSELWDTPLHKVNHFCVKGEDFRLCLLLRSQWVVFFYWTPLEFLKLWLPRVYTWGAVQLQTWKSSVWFNHSVSTKAKNMCNICGDSTQHWWVAVLNQMKAEVLNNTVDTLDAVTVTVSVFVLVYRLRIFITTLWLSAPTPRIQLYF